MTDPNFTAAIEPLGDAWQFISANLPAALAAFFGTFLGAWFAFLFERRHQKQLEIDADLAAASQAYFALLSQRMTMTNIRDGYLDPKEEDEHRYMKLKPYLVLPDNHYPKIPFDRLGYFLKDAEGANVLGVTMAAENRFFTVVRLLEQRNFRWDDMQRVMAEHGPEMVIGTRDAMNRAIVKEMTDSLYKSADNVLGQQEASIKAIERYLMKRFPKHPYLPYLP